MYDEAFEQKFAPIVRAREQRLAILTDCLCPDLAVAAFDGEQLLGLAGFHHEGRSFTGGGSAAGIIKRLGVWRGLRAVVLFGLLERRPAEGELLMDGIVVDAAARGKGIGSGLLERLVGHATEHGYSSIRLDVVDTNPAARRLYERHGFRATRTERTPYLRWMGFSAATTMIRSL